MHVIATAGQQTAFACQEAPSVQQGDNINYPLPSHFEFLQKVGRRLKLHAAFCVAAAQTTLPTQQLLCQLVPRVSSGRVQQV